MIVAEAGPVAPLAAYAIAVIFGADHVALLVPMLICEVAGICLYMFEVRNRFKYRGGRRR